MVDFISKSLYKIDGVVNFLVENARSGEISQKSKLTELQFVINFIRKSLYKLGRVSKFLAENAQSGQISQMSKLSELRDQLYTEIPI